jgi:DNA-binding IclR family transcriptional regulator
MGELEDILNETGNARWPGLVGSLVHGLSILDLFGKDETSLGVGEIARRLSVHRSTASRLAATLSYCGYLQPDGEQGRYRLGAKLVMLGQLANIEIDLQRLGEPLLLTMASELGESVHLGVLDGREVVTTALADGWRTVRMHSTLGKHSPAHCSARGKAILAGLSDENITEPFKKCKLETPTPNTIRTLPMLKAELKKIRERGYATDNEELELGLKCIAAPVLDHSGKIVAAVSVSGPASRLEGNPKEKAVKSVVSTATELSKRLGSSARSGYDRWLN